MEEAAARFPERYRKLPTRLPVSPPDRTEEVDRQSSPASQRGCFHFLLVSDVFPTGWFPWLGVNIIYLFPRRLTCGIWPTAKEGVSPAGLGTFFDLAGTLALR